MRNKKQLYFIILLSNFFYIISMQRTIPKDKYKILTETDMQYRNKYKLCINEMKRNNQNLKNTTDLLDDYDIDSDQTSDYSDNSDSDSDSDYINSKITIQGITQNINQEHIKQYEQCINEMKHNNCNNGNDTDLIDVPIDIDDIDSDQNSDCNYDSDNNSGGSNYEQCVNEMKHNNCNIDNDIIDSQANIEITTGSDAGHKKPITPEPGCKEKIINKKKQFILKGAALTLGLSIIFTLYKVQKGKSKKQDNPCINFDTNSAYRVDQKINNKNIKS